MSLEQVNALTSALLDIDQIQVKKIIDTIITHSKSDSVLEQVITKSFELIGKGWEEGTIALAQVYMSGRIIEEIINNIQFKPKILSKPPSEKIAIAVLDDFHILGKKIVLSLLRTFGFVVIDYGHGLSVDTLFQMVLKDHIQILLISVLMLPSAYKVKELVQKMRDAHLTTKVLVGGAPFNFDATLWKEVNADAMGHTASEGIELMKAMLYDPNRGEH